MSYSTLKTNIANYLNRSDLTSYLDTFIDFAEARIYRELRIQAMEQSLSSAISSGVVAVPTGYLDMKFAYIDGSPVQPLQRKSLEFIYDRYPSRAADGKPKYFSREGSSFIFGPYPDSAYTMKGVYYKSLDGLSDSNTTNWFTTNAPDLLLFAALCEAEPFLKNDGRIPMWEAKYNAVKNDVQSNDNRERYSGSALSMSPSWS